MYSNRRDSLEIRRQFDRRHCFHVLTYHVTSCFEALISKFSLLDSIHESSSDTATPSRPTSPNETDDNRSSRSLSGSPPRGNMDKSETEVPWSLNRIPSEMKFVGVAEKTVLQASCNISTGRSWGPYHIASMKRQSTPLPEVNSNQMIAQVSRV